MWLKDLAVGYMDSSSWISEGLPAGRQAVPTDAPGPSSVPLAVRPLLLPPEGREGLAGQDADLGRLAGPLDRGAVEAELAACPSSFLAQGITSKLPEEACWCILSAADIIYQEISLIPELPHMPFDLIVHEHRQ